MGIAIRPQLPRDTGAASEEWRGIAERMTASERMKDRQKDASLDIAVQKAREAERHSHRKGCMYDADGKPQIPPCGFSRCDSCGANQSRRTQ